MGRKAREALIKDKMKKEKEEKKNNISADRVFHNKLVVDIMELNMHLDTIYKLIKIKHIDQMLANMWDATIKQYKLHEPTVIRLQDKDTRIQIENIIENKTGKKLKIQV